MQDSFKRGLRCSIAHCPLTTCTRFRAVAASMDSALALRWSAFRSGCRERGKTDRLTDMNGSLYGHTCTETPNTATCGPVLTDLCGEVAALQR